MHTGTRRVGDYHVRVSMIGDKLVGEDILHVSCEERRVVDAIDGRVDLGVLNSLGHILDSHHLTGLTSHEVGNRTSACI